MKNHWKIEDMSWRSFCPTKVDPCILRVIKTASLIEYNAQDYGFYLRNVFKDDPEFLEALESWVQDEEKHGLTLGRWARKADPSFDLDQSLTRFHGVFQIPKDETQSIRGSCTGELIARCIVETGTSTFYTALAQSSQEPLLRQICQSIAADEFRHYKFFYTYLKSYIQKQPISLFQRLKIALGRIQETESDELAGAYFAANALPEETYSLKKYKDLYLGQLYQYYRPMHISRMIQMVCKAIGLSGKGFWISSLGRFYFKHLISKHKHKFESV
jgi:rubrerythrin